VAAHRWQSVAVLVDPVRRALFDYVSRQDHPVSREEAAEIRGVSRSLAAFHLDKLVEAGLLCARYEAPQDQPRGRGRTPKVYEPASDGLMVTIPERRYDLLGEILADAVAVAPAEAADAARRLAFERGHQLGENATGPGGSAAGPGGSAAGLEAVLTDLGFEPFSDHPAQTLLANCPFHSVATRQTELVCGINLAFVAGLLNGLGDSHLTARLVPRPGACCVEIDRTS
jgi:predicted ArsR family transcriptional regulator